MAATFNAEPLPAGFSRAQATTRPAAASVGGASASGSVDASGALAGHLSASDPHPQYLPESGGVLTGALSVIPGTAGAPGVSASGDTDTGVLFPAANTIGFAVGGTQRLSLDSVGRLILWGDQTPEATALNAGGNILDVTGSATFLRDSNDANGPYVEFCKRRGTSSVAANDVLGWFMFEGYDGSVHRRAAEISAAVDGTPGAGDMPGRLIFGTTADGASSPTERLRIISTGAWGLSGPNYGTSGQVLRSQGSTLPPSWVTGTITLGTTAAALGATVPSLAGLTSVSSAEVAAGLTGLGYGTGSGAAVVQLTSRTTGVTVNRNNGRITLVSAAGSTTPFSFVVTNSAVVTSDVVLLSVRSATNVYLAFVTAVGTGSFTVTMYTTGGTATDAPVVNFVVLKTDTTAQAILGTYSQEVLLDVPVHYYRMQETSGTSVANLGSSGLAGTYTGTYTLNQAAFAAGGKSVQFTNGSISTGSATDYTSAFTVSCFINAAASGHGTLATIVGKAQYFASNTQDFPFALVWDPTTQEVLLRLASNNDFTVDTILSTTGLSAGVDYHIAAVYRASGVCQLWVNGVLNASTTIAYTIASSSPIQWRIGEQQELGGGVGQSHFNGRIGEVAIFSSALSQLRIESHWAARNNT